jgi:hypothetical protein
VKRKRVELLLERQCGSLDVLAKVTVAGDEVELGELGFGIDQSDAGRLEYGTEVLP